MDVSLSLQWTVKQSASKWIAHRMWLLWAEQVVHQKSNFSVVITHRSQRIRRSGQNPWTTSMHPRLPELLSKRVVLHRCAVYLKSTDLKDGDLRSHYLSPKQGLSGPTVCSPIIVILTNGAVTNDVQWPPQVLSTDLDYTIISQNDSIARAARQFAVPYVTSAVVGRNNRGWGQVKSS